MDLDKQMVILKINVNEVPMGSEGYINDITIDGLYEIYIPKYEETIFIDVRDFEKMKKP